MHQSGCCGATGASGLPGAPVDRTVHVPDPEPAPVLDYLSGAAHSGGGAWLARQRRTLPAAVCPVPRHTHAHLFADQLEGIPLT